MIPTEEHRMKSSGTMRENPKTILIVDDEEDVRYIVSEMIAEMGFAVYGAESGQKALDLVSHTPVDLVISDVKMEGMDGLSLARRLRRRFPKLPLALMTAYPSDDVHRLLREKEIDFLLIKPFFIDELQNMVLSLAG